MDRPLLLPPLPPPPAPTPHPPAPTSPLFPFPNNLPAPLPPNSEIIANLAKAAGLATMIAAMRPDIDNVDEYVRNTTARAFSGEGGRLPAAGSGVLVPLGCRCARAAAWARARPACRRAPTSRRPLSHAASAVVASALGIPALLPFLKAVCQSKKSWQARHTGIKVVQQIAILMGCAVLPHLKSLVDIVKHGARPGLLAPRRPCLLVCGSAPEQLADIVERGAPSCCLPGPLRPRPSPPSGLAGGNVRARASSRLGRAQERPLLPPARG